MKRSSRPALGSLAFFSLALGLSVYFTFAAVQGDFGLFKRAEVNAEAMVLRQQLSEVQAKVARMENLTLRLSDDYLDLDLLDQQARAILGMISANEIVIQ